MTEQQVVAKLRSLAKEKSQRRLAKEMGCSAMFINDVLHGRRSPTGPILRYLGLARVTRYVAAPSSPPSKAEGE